MGQSSSSAYPESLDGCLSSECITFDSYGSTRNLRLSNVPIPPLLRPDMVMIEVSVASLSQRDLRRVKGEFSNYLTDRGWPKMIGYEGVGKVHSIGGDVTHLRLRQEVMFRVEPGLQTMFGAASEFAIVPGDAVVPKPARWSDQDAATLPVAGLEALQALQQLEVESDDKLLIIHQGSSAALLAIEIAKKHFRVADLRVLVFSEEDEQACLSRGADQVVRVETLLDDESLAAHAEQLMPLREWSPDAVLDCSSSPSAVMRVVLNQAVGRPSRRARRVLSMRPLPSADEVAGAGHHVSLWTHLHLHWNRDSLAEAAAKEFGLKWMTFCPTAVDQGNLQTLSGMASKAHLHPLPIAHKSAMGTSWGVAVKDMVSNVGKDERWLLFPGAEEVDTVTLQ